MDFAMFDYKGLGPATLNSFKKLSQFDNGGPGSGNFGHAGRPGEVGGSASVKNLESEVISLASQDVEDSEGLIMASIAKVKGFDGKPSIVSHEEFESKYAHDYGYTVLYRGQRDTVNDKADKFHEQFVDGDYRVSAPDNSKYGRGYYFSIYEQDAKRYATKDGGEGIIERVVLSPEAKVYEYDEISPQESSRLTKGLRELNDKIKAVHGRKAAEISLSTYLAMEGYSAYKSEEYVCVFDRSAVIMDEKTERVKGKK